MSYQGIADFRSDTVTRPTDEMRKAMYDAEVGDDVHRDDPTIIKLEEMAADKLGKEAAIFLPSGTMGNTIAMKLAAGEGKEVILEEKCHILNFESGNISRIAMSLPRPLPSNKGEISIELIKENIKTTLREHVPDTRALSLENTHNFWGGAILSINYLKKVKTLADEYNLHLHLDGARIFNAAVALKIDVKEIACYFDTVMFCLSKGLSAPIGSILAGSKNFVEESRFVRKYLGGGMRQVGIIAAAGIISLEKMVNRLEEDHLRAKKLAVNISDIKEIEVDPDETVTNFVMIKLNTLNAETFLKKLSNKKVLALPFTENLIRFVTHKDIDDNDVDLAVNSIREIFS